MKNRSQVLFSLLFSATVASQSATAGIIADGNYADWSINQSDLSSADSSVHHTVEDQHSWYLSPGYGGQAYDAEGIYTRTSGGK